VSFTNKYLAVAYAAVFLALQPGCGADSSGGTDQPSDDFESRRQGESLKSLESRWKHSVKDKPTGVTSSISITGKSLYLTTSGQAQVDAPGVLAVAPLFPKNQRCLFFADAQVGAETGLLVLEGPRVQLTAGTLGILDIGSGTASTQAPEGSPSPVVELSTEDKLTASKPSVTFPADWNGTSDSLFFSKGAAVHASNITLSGFTRGLLVTASGTTPLTGSVTVTAATRMYWDAKSRIQVASSTVTSPTFALGGQVEAGALTSTELQSLSAPPSMVNGHQAQVTLRPGSAKSEGSFQLTQAVTQEGGMVLTPELELAFDTTPVTVKTGQRVLIPVVFREKGLKGDAVLSGLEITGSGKDAVRVPLGHVDTYLEQLWTTVGESGIAAPFLAVAIAPLSPFIALGEALSCLLSTCPAPYPVWVSAGHVETFHIIVQGNVAPGTYEANVTLTGRNYAPMTIPVQFTVTQ
jgi:hypothetical protein